MDYCKAGRCFIGVTNAIYYFFIDNAPDPLRKWKGTIYSLSFFKEFFFLLDINNKKKNQQWYLLLVQTHRKHILLKDTQGKKMELQVLTKIYKKLDLILSTSEGIYNSIVNFNAFPNRTRALGGFLLFSGISHANPQGSASTSYPFMR